MKYELVSGLETHIELSTKTKIFCGCKTEFGGEPNTHCCPICIGLPGTLPKLNKEVVNYAIRAGLATNCEINFISKMDRKNYVYPDLPKAYQISQYDLPLCKNGYIELENGRKIRIARMHIEEDAGKLVHKAGDVYVDYNRGGVPLIEIVTEPDIRSPEEGREYVEKLQLIMRYIGISDCRMQEGSMRCDVNISVRPEGSDKLGTRTEIKNMNSLTFMTKAMAYEKERQIDILTNGGKVEQETLRYKEESGTTESMRDKEDANDYRYFRDPDLITIHTSKEDVEEIRKLLPELPHVRLKKYVEEFGISDTDAQLIVKYKNISDYFEKAIKGIKNPKLVSNFIIGQIFRTMENEQEKEKFDVKVRAEDLCELVKLIEDKKINSNLAKSTLNKMLETGKKVTELLSSADLEGIPQDKLREICKNAVQMNENAVKDYLSGKEKALKAILGVVMKETRGKANPQDVQTEILDIINKNK